MDIRMPRLDGIEAARRIMAFGPGSAKVVMLTTFDLDEYVFDALGAGATGFLLKHAPKNPFRNQAPAQRPPPPPGPPPRYRASPAPPPPPPTPAPRNQVPSSPARTPTPPSRNHQGFHLGRGSYETGLVTPGGGSAMTE